LVEQEYTAKQQTAPPGVSVRPRLGLCPQVEQRVRDQHHGQEHADPRANHQGELSKCIDQQVKVQHQSEAKEIKVERRKLEALAQDRLCNQDGKLQKCK